MFAFLSAFFSGLFGSTADYTSYFNGNWYLNFNNNTVKATLMIKLNFYKKQKELDQYFLESLNETAKDVINNDKNNENLFVLGSMQIKQFYRKQKILIAGFFKSETNQLFLIHSLEHFLTNKVINNINISDPSITKNAQLITFLSSIESIYSNKTISEPTIDDPNFNYSNFVDQLQGYAIDEFTNFSNDTIFPLIYLQLLRTNTAPKIFENCNLHGLININIPNITTGPNSTTNFIKIDLYQFDIKLLGHKVGIYTIIYSVLDIIKYNTYFLVSLNYGAALCIGYTNLFNHFLPFYFFENDAFYDFKGEGFSDYKQVHIIFFFIDFGAMLYRKFSPLIKSLINGRYLPELKDRIIELLKSVLVVSFCYFISFRDGDNNYSLILLFYFTNIVLNCNFSYPTVSIYEVIESFCSLFGIGIHYLLYKNAILIDKYDSKLFWLTFVSILAQSIFVMVMQIKSGFSPIKLYRNFRYTMFPYDYYKKKPKNGIKCPICQDKLIVDKQTCVVAPCKHAFHEKCFIELINSHQDAPCPVCQAYFPPFNEKKHAE